MRLARQEEEDWLPHRVEQEGSGGGGVRNGKAESAVVSEGHVARLRRGKDGVGAEVLVLRQREGAGKEGHGT